MIFINILLKWQNFDLWTNKSFKKNKIQFDYHSLTHQINTPKRADVKTSALFGVLKEVQK